MPDQTLLIVLMYEHVLLEGQSYRPVEEEECAKIEEEGSQTSHHTLQTN